MTPTPRRAGQTKPRRLNGELLDVTAVAQLLGATEKQIRTRVARGLLPHRRWGGRVIFVRAEVFDFLHGLEGVSVEQALANVKRRQHGTAAGGDT